jgi:hypothetical protein
VPQRGKNDCGVACVAILAGCSYDKALAAFGPISLVKNGTTTRQVAAALRRLGLDAEDRLRPMPRDWGPLFAGRTLVKVELYPTSTRRWHWSVIGLCDGRSVFFDPLYAEPQSGLMGRITSYLKVR